MRKVSGLDEILAGHFSAMLPEAEREYFSIVRSTVDVGVWVVGLSTGIIAVLMSSESARDILGQGIFRAGVILFSLVIMFGVIQRILFHIAELRKWPLSLRLKGSLIGLTDKTLIARELQDFWTVSEIVDRLREDFGVDYSFLIETQATIEQARDAYASQLKIHREFEKTGLSKLAEIMCAHYGLPKTDEENYFNSADLEIIRNKAKAVDKIFNVSFYSYYLSAFLFAVGIITLAYGAI